MADNDTVQQITYLQGKVAEAQKKIQDARIAAAVIDEKFEALNALLLEAIGSNNWDELDAEIDKAEKEAYESIQALVEALNDAGVDVFEEA